MARPAGRWARGRAARRRMRAQPERAGCRLQEDQEEGAHPRARAADRPTKRGRRQTMIRHRMRTGTAGQGPGLGVEPAGAWALATAARGAGVLAVPRPRASRAVVVAEVVRVVAAGSSAAEARSAWEGRWDAEARPERGAGLAAVEQAPAERSDEAAPSVRAGFALQEAVALRAARSASAGQSSLRLTPVVQTRYSPTSRVPFVIRNAPARRATVARAAVRGSRARGAAWPTAARGCSPMQASLATRPGSSTPARRTRRADRFARPGHRVPTDRAHKISCAQATWTAAWALWPALSADLPSADHH